MFHPLQCTARKIFQCLSIDVTFCQNVLVLFQFEIVFIFFAIQIASSETVQDVVLLFCISFEFHAYFSPSEKFVQSRKKIFSPKPVFSISGISCHSTAVSAHCPLDVLKLLIQEDKATVLILV